ncbi:hypothetical protein ACFLSJ_00980 [Verrucomicrobiota bacterium]
MTPEPKLVPQLVVEIDEGLADALDRAFGKGGFERWAERLRLSGLAGAWGGDEEAPPVFVHLGEDLMDRLTTDEDRRHAESIGFDGDGFARRGEYAVRVVPVETGVKDVEVTMTGWLSAVPETEEGAT